MFRQRTADAMLSSWNTSIPLLDFDRSKSSCRCDCCKAVESTFAPHMFTGKLSKWACEEKHHRTAVLNGCATFVGNSFSKSSTANCPNEPGKKNSTEQPSNRHDWSFQLCCKRWRYKSTYVDLKDRSTHVNSWRWTTEKISCPNKKNILLYMNPPYTLALVSIC